MSPPEPLNEPVLDLIWSSTRMAAFAGRTPRYITDTGCNCTLFLFCRFFGRNFCRFLFLIKIPDILLQSLHNPLHRFSEGQLLRRLFFGKLPETSPSFRKCYDALVGNQVSENGKSQKPNKKVEKENFKMPFCLK